MSKERLNVSFIFGRKTREHGDDQCVRDNWHSEAEERKEKMSRDCPRGADTTSYPSHPLDRIMIRKNHREEHVIKAGQSKATTLLSKVQLVLLLYELPLQRVVDLGCSAEKERLAVAVQCPTLANEIPNVVRHYELEVLQRKLLHGQC